MRCLATGPLRLPCRTVFRVATRTQSTLGAHCAPFPSRSHTCGGLSAQHAGARVVLTGWLLPERKAGKAMSFFPLRDSSGTAQLVVFRSTAQPHADGVRAAEGPPDDVLPVLAEIPMESAVLVEGEVRLRPEKQRRPEPAGDVEVVVDKCTLLNPADRHLPFWPSDTQNLPNEDVRARYRYLDLRRPALAENLRKRSRVAHIIRSELHEQDFVEVETPILLKSTPEGAREFLVPTRTSSASASASAPLFYALPQSPQQPKQLLVCSGGVDRYFQLARCFRDEDGRRDRQPEFTQVDLEMAFVSWGPPANARGDGWRIGGTEVRDVVERVVRAVWSAVEGVDLPPRFAVLRYAEAMARFGSDKPDTRFALEITDVSERLPAPLRARLAQRGELVEALVVPANAKASPDARFAGAAAAVAAEEAEAEALGVAQREDRAQAQAPVRDRARASPLSVTLPSNSSGLSPRGYVVTAGDAALPLGSVLGADLFADVGADVHADVAEEAGAGAAEMEVRPSQLGLRPGDTVWLARRRRVAQGGSTVLGRLRVRLSELAETRGDYTPPPEPHFLWVTEFPLFTRADADKDFLAHGRWSSSHHPFTAPMWEDVEALYDGRVEQVRGQHYDLVLNGVEIGGGSVRVHDPVMQEYIFSQILQLDETEKGRFGHLLHALRCGAPPHGGLALGFDRLMAILCKTKSIRDVIAFPKTSAGTDPLFKSPAPAAPELLAQYGLRPL